MKNHDFESIEECDSFYCSAFAIMLLAVIIGIMCLFAVESLDRTAENQERYYSKPVELTYERPAAYRLQSPTPEQMEKLHDMQRIAEVRR